MEVVWSFRAPAAVGGGCDSDKWGRRRMVVDVDVLTGFNVWACA